MTSRLLQRPVADETRVIRMTRFGHQLTVCHDTRVHVVGGTQALVTGISCTGSLAWCQVVVTDLTIGGHVSGGGHGPLAVRRRVSHVFTGGVVGGGGRQKLSPHSHNLPCGPRRVRVVFFVYYIYHHNFKKQRP